MVKGKNATKVILVTGGTGLLGRRIVNRLHQSGYRVRVLTRSTSLPVGLPVERIRGDIRNRAIVAEAAAGCSAVFHCAAELRDEKIMYDINVLGTKNIYETAQAAGVSYLCHISSAGVFGRTKRKILDEDAPCDPMNTYEATKLQAERIIGQGIEGCHTAILRPTNIFAEESLIADDLKPLSARVKVWLKGRERAHLVYGEDVAAAAVYFMENQRTALCETFIVSSDEEPGNTIGEVHSYIEELQSGKTTCRHYPVSILVPYCLRLLRHGRSNRGDVCYSSHRLFATGFKMPFGYRAGLRRAVESHREKVRTSA